MGNGEDIKMRLKKVLEVKNSNVSKITEGENVKRSTLSAQLNGNSAVSADTISLFLKKFRDVSAEWLTRGIGSMFCPTPSDPDAPYRLNDSDSENGLTTEVERTHNGGTSEEVAFYKEQAEFYKQQASFYREQAEFYKNKNVT